VPRVRSREPWAKYEELAHKIVKDLMPFADVTLDDHLYGSESEDLRQIDVSARWRDGDQDRLLIVQVKDLKRPADVNVVGTYKSVIQDTRAHQGVLICSGGFSKKARTYARNVGISLYALHEAGSRNWAQNLTVPLIWVSLEPTLSMSGSFRPHVDGHLVVAKNNYMPILSRDGGATRLRLADVFIEQWNDGSTDRSLGAAHELRLDGEWSMLYYAAGDKEAWAEMPTFAFSYTVNRRSWLGQYRPSECRGLIDFLASDLFIPTFMRLDDLPRSRDDTWVQIDDPDRVALETVGLVITSEQFKVETGSARFEVINIQEQGQKSVKRLITSSDGYRVEHS